MSDRYEHVLKQIADSIRHYHGLDVRTEVIRGADLFPESTAITTQGRTTYVIRFNPKVETLLSLYNRAMEYGEEIGETVTRYVLFHAFLELDDYAGSHRHLEAFRSEVKRLKLNRRIPEEQEDAANRILIQIYYILFHESFHIIFKHSPELKSMATDTTIRLLRDMKEELADQLSTVTNEELLSHPKTRKHIRALIPPSLPRELREEMEARLYEEMKNHPYSTDYIDQLIAGSDSLLLEELSCDRQAWLNFASMAESDGCTPDDLLQFHLWFYVVFCAMDFNLNLQSQYRPTLRTGYCYDGRRVVFRHKAFKTLLRQYNPEVYRLVSHHYLDRHKGLEAIFRTATLGIFRYHEDFIHLHDLYDKRVLQPVVPDFRQVRQQENEMAEIAQKL